MFWIKRWKQTVIIPGPLSGRVTEPAVSDENCIYTEGHSENNSSGPYLELLMKNFLVQVFTETKKGMCLQKPSLNLMSSELRLMVWEENLACLSMVYPV